jgi:deoxyadenosine/deoxycytidine kinase
MNAQLNQEAETPDYIVVEGPIGVGKTTLANKLARSFGSDLLLEGATENPFLEKFYENPKVAALPITKTQKQRHCLHSYFFYFSAHNS